MRRRASGQLQHLRPLSTNPPQTAEAPVRSLVLFSQTASRTTAKTRRVKTPPSPPHGRPPRSLATLLTTPTPRESSLDMPPRKSARGKKAAAPAEAPAPPPPAPEELDATAPSTSTTAEPAPGTAVDEVDAEQEQQEQIAQEDAAAAEAGGDEEQQPAQAGPSSGATMEDRMAKMKELRQRMVRPQHVPVHAGLQVSAVPPVSSP